MDELAWPLPPTAAEHTSESWKWRGGIVKCNSGNGRLVRFITVEILPPERVPIILNHFPEHGRATAVVDALSRQIGCGGTTRRTGMT